MRANSWRPAVLSPTTTFRGSPRWTWSCGCVVACSMTGPRWGRTPRLTRPLQPSVPGPGARSSRTSASRRWRGSTISERPAWTTPLRAGPLWSWHGPSKGSSSWRASAVRRNASARPMSDDASRGRRISTRRTRRLTWRSSSTSTAIRVIPRGTPGGGGSSILTRPTRRRPRSYGGPRRVSWSSRTSSFTPTWSGPIAHRSTPRFCSATGTCRHAFGPTTS
mmetsp:Transcript_66589/g.111375  ORF Transcript_66589/g.111375 Transcript_66589/m.111375 type:complete len:221 (-) Transcript_66589:1045-1707(-)